MSESNRSVAALSNGNGNGYRRVRTNAKIRMKEAKLFAFNKVPYFVRKKETHYRIFNLKCLDSICLRVSDIWLQIKYKTGTTRMHRPHNNMNSKVDARYMVAQLFDIQTLHYWRRMHLKISLCVKYCNVSDACASCWFRTIKRYLDNCNTSETTIHVHVYLYDKRLASV